MAFAARSSCARAALTASRFRAEYTCQTPATLPAAPRGCSATPALISSRSRSRLKVAFTVASPPGRYSAAISAAVTRGSSTITLRIVADGADHATGPRSIRTPGLQLHPEVAQGARMQPKTPQIGRNRRPAIRRHNRSVCRNIKPSRRDCGNDSHARSRWFEPNRAHQRSCKWAGFDVPRVLGRDSKVVNPPGRDACELPGADRRSTLAPRSPQRAGRGALVWLAAQGPRAPGALRCRGSRRMVSRVCVGGRR